jgi:hypothetical protein
VNVFRNWMLPEETADLDREFAGLGALQPSFATS